ncbi:MAG: HEAT repeat domain-containing protein [Chloroflexi bacterium]|nr:HEAT repeat domain-containing protein [Chloroflexota bacterium]
MADLTFQTVLDHLLDSKKDIPASHLAYYSDLDPKSLRLFMDIWKNVPANRKTLLLDRLAAHLDEDTIVSYEDIGRALLDDPDAEVRARALGLLAESDDPRLVDTLLKIFQADNDLAPRIKAGNLLGEFVLMGELEELDETRLHKIEEALIRVIRSDENPSLRRAALEAFGYSGREEALSILESAYEREDPLWVTSALRAMGRSHDNRWNDSVISKLLDADPRVRYAAAEAAGELTITEAAPIMIKMLEDEEEDDAIAMAAIWALSQIGGEDARAYILNMLDNTEDEDVVEFLEDALENLDFNEQLDRFDLLALDEDDDLSELDKDEFDDGEDDYRRN